MLSARFSDAFFALCNHMFINKYYYIILMISLLIYFTFQYRVLISWLLPYKIDFVLRGLSANIALRGMYAERWRGFSIHFHTNVRTMGFSNVYDIKWTNQQSCTYYERVLMAIKRHNVSTHLESSTGQEKYIRKGNFIETRILFNVVSTVHHPTICI